MSLTKCLSMVAGAAVSFGVLGVANAEAVSNTNTDEVRAIVAEMLADADTRSSFLQSGGTAGHDGKKFFLASSGGDFSLSIGGQLQFRYLVNFGDDLGGQADEDWEGGFQTRRTKLWFHGTVFNEFDYMVKWEFNRNGGGAGLQDAWVSTPIMEGWDMKWGQFKAPFMREELVSSTSQLAVDRSHMNEIFNQDYSQGIELSYSQDDWNLALMFSDGFGSDNSDYATDRGLGTVGTAGGIGGESDYAFTGRFQYKFAGDWSQFKDFTSASGSNWAWMLGAALHYEGGDSEGNSFGGGDYNYLSWTADLSFEGDGWNAFVAGVGGYTDFEDIGGIAGADADFDDYGVVVQGGIMIPDTNWEIFGRYDAVFPDSDRAGDDTFNVITAGVNYYMHGHAAKLTADFQWFIDDPADTSIASPSTGIGFLGDSDEDEFGIRLQFQLLF